MTNSNLFELVKLINASRGDPSAMTDAIWEAGYRQPVRSAEEAAKITIELFFYCNSFSMPTDFWPRDYDSVLEGELMKAIIGEDGELDGADAATIARSVIDAGFAKQHVVNDITTGKPLTIRLPDTSSKAFWSGTGKHEAFHPDTYKRWVKEAIERACVIGGIGVEVN